MPETTLPASRGAPRRICLHVGCGLPSPGNLHPTFRGADWREVRVDIDPQVQPDIVASITDLHMIATGSVDAVWSSHNLEHLYSHEVPVALDEFRRVLKADGFVMITLPDLQRVAKLVAADQLEDVAYISSMGPITPLDILYGHRASISAGQHYMAHRTGFTARTLHDALARAGFENIQLERTDLNLWARGVKPPERPHLSGMSAVPDASLRPSSSALAQAVEEHNAGRLAVAEELYRQVLNEEPANADAIHLLGVIAFQRRDMQAAVQRIQQAISINPQSENFYTNLGAVFQETGRLDEALLAYRRALELKPDLAEAHNNLGNVFNARQRHEQALECYRRALTLNPDLFEALNNLGNICSELGRIDEAVAAYQRALELRPDATRIRDDLARIVGSSVQPAGGRSPPEPG